MSSRHQIQAVLRDWREAERRFELASAREAELIEREIVYYRSLHKRLCSVQMDAAMAGLREDEERRALRLSGPTSS